MMTEEKRMHRKGKYYDVKRRRDGTFKKVDSWSSKDEGCFIATAAYGTPMAVEIDYLRVFRDNDLKKNLLTRQLIYLYYSTSPPISKIISSSKISFNSFFSINKRVFAGFFLSSTNFSTS